MVKVSKSLFNTRRKFLEVNWSKEWFNPPN